MSTASVAPLELNDLHWGDFPDGLTGLDWTGVAHVDLGGGYDWEEFAVWFSPSQRIYYWASGAGCSCNSFGEGLRSVGDFESGDKAAAIAAANRFFEDSYRTNIYSLGATLTQAIGGFRPPRKATA